MQSSLIKNRKRASQILAFDGLQKGLCRPCDIDFSMDLQGNTFIFGELKCTGVPLTVGQKLHLQWLVDAIEAGGKRAVAFYATHDTPLGEDVHVAKSVIKRLYTGGVWVTMDVTVEEYINEIL